jgi:hypothetical protein
MKPVKSVFRVFHENSIVDNSRGKYSRIFEYAKRKYKMQYRLENGVSELSLYLMTIQGDWALVMTNFDLGHIFSCSYVSGESAKSADIKSAIALVERVIPQIWD